MTYLPSRTPLSPARAISGTWALIGSPVGIAPVLDGAVPHLMVTDPPYGVSYDPAWRHRAGVNRSRRRGKVANDERADWGPA